MADAKEVLTFSVELGDQLLRNGGEVYRIEDSILAMLNSYGITDCDVYVISNGIFASANESSEDACSIIRHVPLAPVHLGKIAALNNLCREVCNQKISIEDAWVKLEEIKQLKEYNRKLLILATGVGCAGFAYLFGGSVLDAFIALIIGLVEWGLMDLLKRAKSSKAVINVFTAAFVTIFAVICYLAKLPVHYDKIIIGDIMPLVPGIAFTTSIRDFVNGDYLSGAIKLIDALLTAFCIAVGVGIVITLGNIITGGVL